jgi:cyclic pyranopterin phosphate synthase
MVEVGEKPATRRQAVAEAQVRMAASTWERLRAADLPKGDVLAVARVAGIMAAKKTSELIPLCHPLPLSGVEVHFTLPEPGLVTIEARARCTGPTGVEMEALTAATVAALTLYDMLKSLEKGIVIEGIRLLAKSGGKSGDWRA